MLAKAETSIQVQPLVARSSTASTSSKAPWIMKSAPRLKVMPSSPASGLARMNTPAATDSSPSRSAPKNDPAPRSEKAPKRDAAPEKIRIHPTNRVAARVETIGNTKAATPMIRRAAPSHMIWPAAWRTWPGKEIWRGDACMT